MVPGIEWIDCHIFGGLIFSFLSKVSPNFEKLDVKSRQPPTLPPHLLQVILNKDVSYQPDPILLEEPSHVMVNHLYAQVIWECKF